MSTCPPPGKISTDAHGAGCYEITPEVVEAKRGLLYLALVFQIA